MSKKKANPVSKKIKKAKAIFGEKLWDYGNETYKLYVKNKHIQSLIQDSACNLDTISQDNYRRKEWEFSLICNGYLEAIARFLNLNIQDKATLLLVFQKASNEGIALISYDNIKDLPVSSDDGKREVAKRNAINRFNDCIFNIVEEAVIKGPKMKQFRMVGYPVQCAAPPERKIQNG